MFISTCNGIILKNQTKDQILPVVLKLSLNTKSFLQILFFWLRHRMWNKEYLIYVTSDWEEVRAWGPCLRLWNKVFAFLWNPTLLSFLMRILRSGEPETSSGWLGVSGRSGLKIYFSRLLVTDCFLSDRKNGEQKW